MSVGMYIKIHTNNTDGHLNFFSNDFKNDIKYFCVINLLVYR